ncbi:MAG: phosphoribosylglycinamide formyltransferase [Pseudobdellovibrionaceae bacterium]
MSDKTLRLAVLISGRGSNLKNILEHCALPDFPAEVVCVISNKEDAPGLLYAKAFNIPSFVVSHKDYASKAGFETALLDAIAPFRVDLICLAGFMRLLSPLFISHYEGKILNIHPSLLPAYKGLDTHQRAIDAGEEYAGCSVHIVTPEMDDGPVLVQRKVEIAKYENADSLAEKVLAEEYIAYPQAIRIVAAEKNAYTEKQDKHFNHLGTSMAGTHSSSPAPVDKDALQASWNGWVQFTHLIKYSVIGICAVLVLLALITL